MSADSQQLIRDWIQYLKQTGIVKPQSDPSTGNLSYKRKVTANDILSFLKNKTDYDDSAIENAIMQVLGRKQDNTKKLPNNSKNVPPEGDPKLGNRQSAKRPGYSPSKIGYDPNSISDIDYREVKEAFKDATIPDISEEQVEEIFRLLLSTAAPESPIAAAAKSLKKSRNTTPSELSPEQSRAKKEEQLRKIKRVIRDTMTDGQRQALWRALNEV